MISLVLNLIKTS